MLYVDRVWFGLGFGGDIRCKVDWIVSAEDSKGLGDGVIQMLVRLVVILRVRTQVTIL